MRARLFSVLLAVAAVAGCKSPPAVVQLAKTDQVKIRVDCLDGGGVSATVDPFRATIHKLGKAIKWTLDSNGNNAAKIDSVSLVPSGPPGTWPFEDAEFKVRKGRATDKNLKDNSEVDVVYKYTIVAICNRIGQQDTVLIDPDMIIPRNY